MSYPNQPVPPHPMYAPAPQPTDPMAIASFVCSLLGLNIVAVVLGHISLSHIKRSGAPGRGFAIAGLIIGYVTFVSLIIVLIAVFGLIAWSTTQ